MGGGGIDCGRRSKNGRAQPVVIREVNGRGGRGGRGCARLFEKNKLELRKRTTSRGLGE